MWWIRGIIGVIISTVTVVFALSNRQMITIHLEPLPYEIDTPLFVAMIMGAMAGVALCGFSVFLTKWGKAWQARDRQKRMATLEHNAASVQYKGNMEHFEEESESRV